MFVEHIQYWPVARQYYKIVFGCVFYLYNLKRFLGVFKQTLFIQQRQTKQMVKVAQVCKGCSCAPTLHYKIECTLRVMLSLATSGCKYLRRVTYRIVGLNQGPVTHKVAIVSRWATLAKVFFYLKISVVGYLFRHPKCVSVAILNKFNYLFSVCEAMYQYKKQPR